MKSSVSRLASGLLALTLLAAACSGGGDEAAGAPSAEEVASDPANAPIAAIDEGSGGVASGPVAGLLTVQPSFGFGVFDVDFATGAAAALPGIASVETIDRNRDLVVGSGAAYSLGAKVRDGQTFAADISVVKIDYATGQVSRLAELGFDRETDDSVDLISHRLEAVAGDNVVVSTGAFGGDDTTFTVYDANSGQAKATFDEPRYEFSGDAGSCSGGISNLVGLSDGRVAGTALGSPAFLNLDSGEIELLIGCDEEDPTMADHVTAAQINDFAVFAQGPAPTADQLESMLNSDIQPKSGFVEGDGDLWWIEANIRQIDDVLALVGGVVQFDIETAQVEAVHSLSANLGDFIECDADGTGCSSTSLVQSDLRWFEGRLIILDTRENGRLLTLDPISGTVTNTELVRGDGVDYTSADLLAGDPNAIWLEVTRFTITKDDDTGRTASGPSYIEHFDPATNQIDMSLPAEEIFF